MTTEIHRKLSVTQNADRFLQFGVPKVKKSDEGEEDFMDDDADDDDALDDGALDDGELDDGELDDEIDDAANPFATDDDSWGKWSADTKVTNATLNQTADALEDT